MERFVCVDVMGEHLPPNSIVVDTPQKLILALQEGNERLVIRDRHITDKERFKEYVAVFRELQDCFVVIDESHLFMSESTIPEPLRKFCQMDLSHNNVGLVLGTQFITKVHTSAFQQADDFVIYSYGTFEDSKLTDVLNAETRRMLESLDAHKFEYLYIPTSSREQPKVCSRVSIPKHLG